MASEQLTKWHGRAEAFCWGMTSVLLIALVVALVIDSPSSIILWVAVAILWHIGFGIFFREERRRGLDKSKQPSLK